MIVLGSAAFAFILANRQKFPVPTAPMGFRVELKEEISEPPLRDPSVRRFGLRYVNLSLRDVTVNSGAFWANHRVRLLDSQGHELPLTKLGLDLRRSLVDAFGNRDHDFAHPLRPGQVFTDYCDLKLPKLYRLEPGRYRLVVDYIEQSGPNMQAVSNELPITIEAAGR